MVVCLLEIYILFLLLWQQYPDCVSQKCKTNKQQQNLITFCLIKCKEQTFLEKKYMEKIRGNKNKWHSKCRKQSLSWDISWFWCLLCQMYRFLSTPVIGVYTKYIQTQQHIWQSRCIFCFDNTFSDMCHMGAHKLLKVGKKKLTCLKILTCVAYF